MGEGINLCFVDMMHQCSFSNWKEQRHCSFKEKSRFESHCTHCHFDQFCQNLDAYPTAKTVRVKAEDLPKIVDRGEEPIWGDSVVKRLEESIVPDIWKRRIEEAGRMLDLVDVPKDERIMFHSTPVGENRFYQMHRDGLYSFGPDNPPEMVSSHALTEYDFDQFIQAIIHYATCEIEEQSLGCEIQFEKFEDRPYDLYHNNEVVFVFKTDCGEKIYCGILIGRARRDSDATKTGRDIACIIIGHYRKIQEKRSYQLDSKIMTPVLPPSMISKVGKWS